MEKKKKNKKLKKVEPNKKRGVLILSLILCGVVLALAILLPLLLRENRMERAERILLEKGYNYVVYVDEKDAAANELLVLNKELKSRLSAGGGPYGEFITILEFKNKKDAEAYYLMFKDDYILTQTMVRHGRYVYYGTRLTYELIK